MKALTVQQPWAWAIIHAGKTVENRTQRWWSYRGPIEPIICRGALGLWTVPDHLIGDLT